MWRPKMSGWQLFNSPRYQENDPEGDLFPLPLVLISLISLLVSLSRMWWKQDYCICRSRSLVRMTLGFPRTCGYTFSIEAERNSPLSMRLFLLWLLPRYFFFSLIALPISISTLTAGYLIIASDDNIGVSDVAIDRFSYNYSDGFDILPKSNYIYIYDSR